MTEKKNVKDIMISIEKYDKIISNDKLCNALALFKKNYEKYKASGGEAFYRVIFVTDASGKIVGKLSTYDLA